ncbi:hypothetical protein [Actinokineospora sp.]|uniref:hypothetical protein n=1 Tax=Actinokineospora sp. TaxID=1872133 RepID=UPI003D6A51D9
MAERPRGVVAAASGRTWAHRAAVGSILAALALIGGGLPSFTWKATTFVLVIGAAGMSLALSGLVPGRETAARPGAGAVLWLVPVLIVVTLEVVNLGLGSTHAHPTLSILLDPPLSGELGRTAAYFIWLAAFWGLVRR